MMNDRIDNERKKWHELIPGGVNPDAGNSLEHFTGSYRRGEKPEFNESTCINCFLCWVFCPENAIIVEKEKIMGVNYDYCKGCGICVNECPVKPVKQMPKPLVMVKETVEG